METAIERRDFLRQAFMAGLVIGFPWPGATADEPPGGVASAIAQARAEMARRKAPGALLVLPSWQRPKMHYGENPGIDQVNRLFGGTVLTESGLAQLTAFEPKPELLGLFARAVFVCADESVVESELGADAARAAVLRLDPGGAVGELVARDPELAQGWDHVLVPRLVALLDGPDAKELEAAAARQRAAFPELAARADTALGQLDAAEFGAREAATVVLAGACDRLGNALTLAARRTGSLEARTRLEQAIATYVAGLARPPELGGTSPAGEEKRRIVVPIGVAWGHATYSACPGCGRGSASAPVRRYLTVVAGKGK